MRGGAEAWEAVTSSREAVMQVKEVVEYEREWLASDSRLRRRQKRLTSRDDVASSLPFDEDQARIDGALCSIRASRSCQHSLKGQLFAVAAGNVQTDIAYLATWATEGTGVVLSQ